MIDNVLLLGVNVMNGNSQVINGYKFSETTAGEIKPGTLVSMDSNGNVKLASSTNANVLGIAGYKGIGDKDVAVIRSGIGVGVRVKSSASSTLIGKQVYIDATSYELTDAAGTTSDPNISTRAKFTSNKQTVALNLRTNERESGNFAMVDFVGGL